VADLIEKLYIKKQSIIYAYCKNLKTQT